MMNDALEKKRPTVTGISPANGEPGTTIICRGDYLGIDYSDIRSVKLGDVECVDSLNWISRKKIEIRCGFQHGIFPIIIHTKSGGIGTSAVKFRVEQLILDIDKEYKIWIDEPLFINGICIRKNVKENLDDNYEDVGDTYSDTMSQHSINTSLSTKRSRTFHRQSLTSVQSSFIDPLRLPVQNRYKLSRDREDNQIDISNKDFDPIKYLIEQHSDKSASELMQGGRSLKSDIRDQEVLQKTTKKRDGEFTNEMQKEVEEEVLIIKENIGQFLDALSILNSVNNLCVKDGKPDSAEQLNSEVNGILKAIDKNFSKDINRKNETDCLRSAISATQRARTISFLPERVDQLLSQNDFMKIISEYQKGLDYVSQHKNHRVFQKLLELVEKQMDVVRSHVKHELELQPLPLEEEKNLIKYFSMLQSDMKDHTWDCFLRKVKFAKSTLDSCVEFYMRKEKKEIERFTEGQTGDRSIQMVETIGNIQLNLRTDFVNEISQILLELLPDLHELMVMYQDNRQEYRTTHETGEGRSTYMVMNIVINVFVTSIQYAAIFTRYPTDEINKNKPQWSLLEAQTNSPKFINFYPAIIGRLKRLYKELLQKNVSPMMIQSSFVQLLQDLQTECVRDVIGRTENDITNLHNSIDWTLCREESDIFGFITNIPFLYEKKVVNFIRLLHQIILDDNYNDEEKDEEQDEMEGGKLLANKSIFVQKTNVIDNFKESIQDTLTLMITKTFHRILSQKCRSNKKISSVPLDDHQIDRVTIDDLFLKKESTNNRNFSHFYEKTFNLTETQKIIITFNSFAYIGNVITKKLIILLETVGYTEIQDLWKTCCHYFQMRSSEHYNSIVKNLQFRITYDLSQEITAGRFDWNKCAEPVNVRPYVPLYIGKLIDLISEITSCSKYFLTAPIDLAEEDENIRRYFNFTEKSINYDDSIIIHSASALEHIIEDIYIKLHSIFKLVRVFSNDGRLQAIIDVIAFTNTVEGVYLDSEPFRKGKRNEKGNIRSVVTDKAKSYKYQLLKEILCYDEKKLSERDRNIMQKCLKKYKEENWLLKKCFDLSIHLSCR
ncbi:hypothetical protein SNEBB_007683 [Seison nebaliae]|nr:hypothetical protein SNEBB_007683 [Seison nebaliae]